MAKTTEKPGTIPGAGRPDRETRQAIFRAVVSAVRTRGTAHLDIARIAQQAHVGKEAIRAWWPTDTGLIIEAFRAAFAADLAYPDTGDFAVDLGTQLRAVARLFTQPETGPHLAAILGQAQTDPVVAGEFRTLVFAPNRAAARQRFAKAQDEGAVRRRIDIDAAIDLTFAPLWFALLVRGGPVTDEYVEEIVRMSLDGIGTAVSRPWRTAAS